MVTQIFLNLEIIKTGFKTKPGYRKEWSIGTKTTRERRNSHQPIPQTSRNNFCLQLIQSKSQLSRDWVAAAQVLDVVVGDEK